MMATLPDGDGSGYVIRVVGWERFQHYQKKLADDPHFKPAWIKVYTRLLGNYEFQTLADSEKWYLIGFWLLAAETRNSIQSDYKWIRRRLGRITQKSIAKLIELGFLTVEKEVSEMDDTEKSRAGLAHREGKGREELTTSGNGVSPKKEKKKKSADWTKEEREKVVDTIFAHWWQSKRPPVRAKPGHGVGNDLSVAKKLLTREGWTVEALIGTLAQYDGPPATLLLFNRTGGRGILSELHGRYLKTLAPKQPRRSREDDGDFDAVGDIVGKVMSAASERQAAKGR